MTRNCLVLLVTALLLAPPARAEPRTSNWRIYHAADGLPDTTCVSVAIGPHGRVLVGHPGTAAIGSLDGYSVTNIPSPGRFYGRVSESPRGQLWVVCDEGLAEYRNDQWTRYPVPELAAAVRAARERGGDGVPIFPVRTGHVIFLLPDALMEFDLAEQGVGRTAPLLSAAQTRLGRFLGLALNRQDGSLWITGEQGLAHVTNTLTQGSEPGTKWAEYFPPEPLHLQNLREPVADPDGGVTTVGVSAETGRRLLVHFDAQQQWETRSVGGENIRFAWRGPDQNWWVATTDTVFQLEAGQETILHEQETGRQFFDLAVEPGGSFWLATSDGLFRYSPPTWQTPAGAGVLAGPVNALTRDPEGRLWFAAPDALACLWSNQWTRFPVPENLRPGPADARALFALGDGKIISENHGGLLQFNRASGQFKLVAPAPGARLRPVGVLSDGTLCVESNRLERGGGLSQFTAYDGANFNAFPYPQPPAGLGSGLLLVSAPGGNPWLVSPRGIVQFRDQKWQSSGPPDGSGLEGLACVTEVSPGRIWCAARAQIWDFDGKTWTTVTRAPARINALLSARDGSVWTATDNGVYRLYNGAWVLNDAGEGLPADAVSSLCEDGAGQIWAGTTGGLSLYHPAADPYPPQTYLVLPPGSDNTFPEGSPVTLVYGAHDRWKFTPTTRLLYSYQLDGKEPTPFQEGWTAPLLVPSAGQHYFAVRSMDRNWNIDPKPVFYEFTIMLPWYREARLLLISGAGLVVAALLAGLAINRHLQLRRSHAEVEAQVALRTKQLELANQELLHSQKMNALGTLAAGIAHDFNSILSIIKGSAQIIEDNLDNPEKIRTRAGRINTVVEQGAGIVKAMLGFTRGSGGALVLCDANALVGETIKLLGDRFLREIEVKFEPEPTLPQVPASPDFIQQILLNLIFNAAEATTERRHIILRTRQFKSLSPGLVLAPAPAPAYVFISVEDSGSGIPPEIMPRIFEPFFTTKSLSARRGTGLGLSMVYELAHQMQAGLAVESAVNKGSTFTLILPVRNLPVEAEANLKPPN